MTTIDRYRQLHTAGVLTDRELDILILRARGLSQNTIAAGLGITRSTVRNHERNAHQKIARHESRSAA